MCHLYIYIYIHLAIKCSLQLFWIVPIYVNVMVLVTNVVCCFIISTLNKFLSYNILSYIERDEYRKIFVIPCFASANQKQDVCIIFTKQ